MKPVIVVAGFPRCGSSLTMQMLHAAGVHCAGEPPSFEDTRAVAGMRGGAMDPEWFASLAGKAVKILEPQINRPPAGIPLRVVWLDRDLEEQARSAVKFLRLIGLAVESGYAKTLARALRRDRPVAIAAFEPWPTLVLSFEAVLANPHGTADRIAAHVGLPLDTEAMAAAVWRRPPQCAPGLDMEMALMERYEVGR